MANEEMAAAWDGPEGDHWAEHAQRYDEISPVFTGALLDRLVLDRRSAVLDLGCGAGTLSVEVGRRVPDGEVLGVDLSSRLLALGKQAAADAGLGHVTFLQADVQDHPFAPASFDVAISSFGAMFFADPVAAFANVRRSLRPGGAIAWLAWRDLGANEWLESFRDALAAGRDLPMPPPGAQGPFSLADEGIATERLAAAGYADIGLERIDAPMWFGHDVDDAWAFVSTLGIARGLTEHLDDGAKADALAALRRSLEDHATGDGVTYDASAWCITARHPG